MNCKECDNYRNKKEDKEEEIPKEIFIVLSKNKIPSRNTYYKRVLRTHKALDNIFIKFKDAQDMTRIWKNGYIVKCEIVEDISERKD